MIRKLKSLSVDLGPFYPSQARNTNVTIVAILVGLLDQPTKALEGVYRIPNPAAHVAWRAVEPVGDLTCASHTKKGI